MELVLREFDGKSLLAATCASRGWTVLIGWKRALISLCETLPEGVFVVKSATPNELFQLKKIKNAGHAICVLDEEGLVTQVSSLESQLRYNQETISFVDRMFLWGDIQFKSFCKALPECADKAILTGSPRSDFWSYYAKNVYKPEIDRLKRKYGDYILFPSSFGGATHRMGREYGVGLTFEMAGKGMSEDMARLMNVQGELLWVTFNEYYDLMPILAKKFNDTNFIIRPHPSETHDRWKILERDFQNIHVVYEGSVTPWILGSRAMLHYRSTTSVEGYLLDVPVLTYEPRVPEYLNIADLELPTVVSMRTETRQGLFDLISQVLNSDLAPKPTEVDDVLSPWIYSQPSDRAASRIEKALLEVAPEPIRPLEKVSVELKEQLKKTANRCLWALNEYYFVKKVLPNSLRYRVIAEDYGRHKESGLDIGCLRASVKECLSQEGMGENTVTVDVFCEGILSVRKVYSND